MIAFTELRLLREWMGYAKGTVLKLPALFAQTLVARKTAEETMVPGKIQRRANDKMVKSSENK
jgi:hypothetical protein